MNELQSDSKYPGWKIVVQSFLTFIPGQILGILGQDKGSLMQKFTAVYYYGREFDVPYGIRITPIGEAFAAYGVSGVILQMLITRFRVWRSRTNLFHS